MVKSAYPAAPNLCAKCTCFVNVKQWAAVWAVLVKFKVILLILSLLRYVLFVCASGEGGG